MWLPGVWSLTTLLWCACLPLATALHLLCSPAYMPAVLSMCCFSPRRQLGLGDDKNRWAPKLLKGFTIIHPDRTLRRNRKPVLKALLLKAQDDAPSGGRRSRSGGAV